MNEWSTKMVVSITGSVRSLYRDRVFKEILNNISPLSVEEGPGFRFTPEKGFEEALAFSHKLECLWKKLGDSHYISACNRIENDAESITFCLEYFSGDSLSNLQQLSFDVEDLLLIAEGTLEALMQLHENGVTHNNLSRQSILYDPENKLCQLSALFLVCNESGDLIFGYTPKIVNTSENSTALYENFSLQIKTDLIALGRVLYHVSRMQVRDNHRFHLFPIDDFVRRLMTTSTEDGYFSVQTALDDVRSYIQSQLIVSNAGQVNSVESVELNAPEQTISGQVTSLGTSGDSDERTMIYDSKLMRRLWDSLLDQLGLTKGIESDVLKVSVCMGESFTLAAVVSVTGMSENAIVFIFRKLQALGIVTKYKTLGAGFSYRFNDVKIYQQLNDALTKLDEINIHLKISQQLEEQRNLQNPDTFIQYVWHRYQQFEGVHLDDESRIGLIADSCQAAEFEVEKGNTESALALINIALDLVQERDWHECPDPIHKSYLQGLALLLRADKLDTLFSRAEIYLKHCTDLNNPGIKGQNMARKSEAIGLLIHAHRIKNEPAIGIVLGLNYLEELGVLIPANPSVASLIKEFVKTKFLLRRYTHQQLSTLPVATDSKFLAIDRVLRSLMTASFSETSNLASVLSLTGVQLSLKYGASAFQSMHYLSFAWVSLELAKYVAFVGGTDGIYKFIHVSKYLEDRFSNDKTTLLNVSCGNSMFFNGFVRPWCEPRGAAIEGLKQTAIKGRSEWDYDCVLRSMELYGYLALVNGDPVAEIEKVLSYFSEFVQVSDGKTSAHNITLLSQFISNVGCDEGVSSGAAIAKSGREDSRSFSENYLQAYHYVLFSQWDDAERSLEQARISLQAVVGQQVFGHFIFLETVVLLQQALSGRGFSAKGKWRVHRNKRVIKNWMNRTPDNFKQWYFCVLALEFAVKGDMRASEYYFDQGIYDARTQQSVSDCALIAELAALFSDQNDLDNGAVNKKADEYRRIAYQYYSLWGVQGKLNQFKTQFPSVVIRELGGMPKSALLQPKIIQGETMESMAQDQQTQTLFDSVLGFLMKMGDFGKVVLLQSHKQTGNDVNTIRYTHTILKSLNILDADADADADYPECIIREIEQSRTDLSLKGEQIYLQYGAEPYIQRHNPVAISCFPIIVDDELIGVLYGEHQHSEPLESSGYWDSIGLIRSLLASSIQRGEFRVSRGNLFLAKLFHDCIAPASAIIKYAEFALNEDIPIEQRQHYIKSARDSAESMLTIVKSLTLEGERNFAASVLDVSAFNLSELANKVVQMLLPSAVEKQIDLISPKIDSQLMNLVGDAQKIQQVLVNLVDNAIKYTETGSVTLVISGLDEGRVLFSVEDTGAGIPAGEMGQIFETYNRVNNEKTRHQEGVGLGLAICKEFVEMMGGEITVLSEVDQGSCFQFSIPLESTQSSASAISADAAVFSKAGGLVRDEGRICGLVVDDNVENAKIAQEMLRIHGVRSDYVLTGGEALDRLERQAYDFVLLDIEMPDMDGFEVSKAIRNTPLLDGLSIVAYTAGIGSQVEAHWLANGFNAYVNKSESTVTIVETIAQSLGRSRKEVTEVVVEDNTSEHTHQMPQLVQTGYAIDQLGWSKKMFSLQVEGFAKRYAAFLETLPLLIGNEDYLAIKSHCHSLKTAALNLGVRELSDLAKGIEIEPKKIGRQAIGSAELLAKFIKLLQTVVTDCEGLLSEPNSDTIVDPMEPKDGAYLESMLEDLYSALKQESPAALAIFRDNKRALSESKIEDAEITALQTAMTNMDFSTALKVLESILKNSAY